MTYDGIKELSTNREGELLIGTAFGELKETKPYIYQAIERKKVVGGSFEIRSPAGQSQTRKFSYGFQVASYDPSYPLIIDPTLSYSTFLGGYNPDFGYGIAVDGSGNAYVIGVTSSGDFPTKNPYQGTNAGSYDAFVTKLSDTPSPTIPTPTIKANGQEDSVIVAQGTPVSITISLAPGDKAGEDADWWVAVSTPFASPANWYSCVYPARWMTGINLYDQAPLVDLSPVEVLNMTLPLGNYTFYFAIDDPDGAPTGPWWGLDSVVVTVQ